MFPAPCQPAVFIATITPATLRMRTQSPAASHVVGRVSSREFTEIEPPSISSIASNVDALRLQIVTAPE